MRDEAPYCCEVSWMVPYFVEIIRYNSVAVQVQQPIKVGLLPQPQLCELVLIPLWDAFALAFQRFDGSCFPPASL